MPDPAPILDYASPLQRRWLAMPAETRLDWEFDPGHVHAIARKAGQIESVAAILFACFILILYAAIILRMRRESATAIVLGFWLLYAALLGLVVRNTWR